MKKPTRTLSALILCLINIFFSFSIEKDSIIWNKSNIIPGTEDSKQHPGLAGAFSGFAGSSYVIAGGANFPEQMPWDGGDKIWHKDIFVSESVDSIPLKRIDLKLSVPAAYGLSFSIPQGVLCIGGCNADSCLTNVFLIKNESGNYVIDQNWPSLPYPLANATGAMWNNKIYLAGGQKELTNGESTSTFLVLDLNKARPEWKELQSWPGDSRGYAVSAIQSNGSDHCFYLFSGRTFNKDSVRVLTDGFEYNIRLNKWRKLNGSFPVMAGTAVATGANHILFFGGVPSLITASADHPGFDNSVRAYHTITETLMQRAQMSVKIPVTTNVTVRNNKFYIGSGEVRPGERTPQILIAQIQNFERSFGWLNIIVIILYFAALSYIGIYFAKKQKTTDDYFKGGGRLPWWAVGLSIFGTTLSAITFMAIPAKSFSSDWSYMLMNAGILLVVPIILYLFIPFYRTLDVTTAYEYLEKRFNSTIRVISSVAFILFQVGRMGIVMFLPAIALNVVTGIDIRMCIMVMGVLSLIYTMIGGIEAVVWTDALQVVVLLGGAILVVILIATSTPDGLSGILREASEHNKFDLGSTAWDLRQSTIWTVLIASFFTNLTTYGTDQTLVQRYMTTATEQEARKSVLTNAVMTIPATILFFFVGTALYVYYRHLPQDLSLTITDGDAILPWYIFTELPQGLAGLLVSGIFAAAMSTLSSSMNSAATAYVTDIHDKFFNQSQKQALRTAKLATCVLGLLGIVFALMMATWEVKSMWDEFNKILGIILGSLGGLFMLGMITTRANAKGALLGLAGSVVIQLLIVQYAFVHLLLFAATGFISCFVLGYLFSLFFTDEKKSIIQYTIFKQK